MARCSASWGDPVPNSKSSQVPTAWRARRKTKSTSRKTPIGACRNSSYIRRKCSRQPRRRVECAQRASAESVKADVPNRERSDFTLDTSRLGDALKRPLLDLLAVVIACVDVALRIDGEHVQVKELTGVVA